MANRVILPNRGPNVAYEAFLEMGLQQDMVYTGCRGFFLKCSRQDSRE